MRSSEGGFTLIEVLVSLALLGLIGGIVLGGTRLAIDISVRGNAKTEALRLKGTELRILHDQLQGALPYRYWIRNDTNRTEQAAFEGTAEGLRFVSRFGLVDGPDSLPRWVSIVSAAGSAGRQMVIEEHPLVPPDNQPGETSVTRAVLNCADFRFEYLDTAGKIPQWYPAWNFEERKVPLPSAVRVQCRTREDVGRLLIPLDYAESARQGLRFE